MENFTQLSFSLEDIEQMEYLQKWEEKQKMKKKFRNELLSEKIYVEWFLTFLPLYKW